MGSRTGIRLPTTSRANCDELTLRRMKGARCGNQFDGPHAIGAIDRRSLEGAQRRADWEPITAAGGYLDNGEAATWSPPLTWAAARKDRAVDRLAKRFPAGLGRHDGSSGWAGVPNPPTPIGRSIETDAVDHQT